MAVTSLDGWIAGTKQIVTLSRTATRVSVANNFFAMFDLAGNPGAGTLSAGNTANGAVPTDATAGFPKITFSSGQGYLSSVAFGGTLNGRMFLYDRVFHVGAIAFTGATTTLTAQPSYSSRAPNGDYAGMQIWLEVETAFVTGNNWSVVVTYTDAVNGAGRSTITTGALAVAALTKGKMLQLALQAGDNSPSKIETVVVTNGVTAMTVGQFNIVVARPLWSGRIVFANDGDTHGFDRTSLPEVFGDSALCLAFAADATSTPVFDGLITIVSG